MAIKSVKELNKGKMKIDLTGPDGNAHVLLGIARRLCTQLGKDSKPIIDDMMSGDYEHLIWVFNKQFGDYVDLYR
jgi:hypothetical protein